MKKIKIFRDRKIIVVDEEAFSYTYFSFLSNKIKYGPEGSRGLEDAVTIELGDEYEVWVDRNLRWDKKWRF